MRIAVTGASGYVGGVLASGLEEAGHEVLRWSRRNTGRNWHPYALTDDPSGLPWKGVEGLLHAAHDFTPRNWAENMDRNVFPGVRLLETAVKHRVGTLLFISSISSYDGTRSHYGRAKKLIEEKTLQLGGIVVRPGLVWGQTSGGVMGALESMAARLPLIPCLSGPGGLSQFLVHQEDLATCICGLFAPPPPNGPLILNAANPEAVPLKTILSLLAQRKSRRKPIVPVPWQAAMCILKTAEWLHAPVSFRSDSLTGLVHRIPHLDNTQCNGRTCHFRHFP